MNDGIRLELLCLHSFCICFQGCYIGLRESPYGDFRAITRINVVITVKVSVCWVCQPIMRLINYMMDYPEKKIRGDFISSLHEQCHGLLSSLTLNQLVKEDRNFAVFHSTAQVFKGAHDLLLKVTHASRLLKNKLNLINKHGHSQSCTIISVMHREKQMYTAVVFTKSDQKCSKRLSLLEFWSHNKMPILLTQIILSK